MPAAVTREEMIAFERQIADWFIQKRIFSPIHLSDGNEDQLIEIFSNINQSDWVFSNWRSHYHALLHHVPPELLKRDLLGGKSMYLNYPEYRFVSSSIVAGVIPIALGTAMGIARLGTSDKVWCFLGDATAETGTFRECREYAENYNWPIVFVIEDNQSCIDQKTSTLWNRPPRAPSNSGPVWESRHVIRYEYIRHLYPHAGADKWIQLT